MVIKAGNASTIATVLNVKNRVELEIEAMLNLLKAEESLVQVNQKLAFIYRLTERLKEDEKENLFPSDEIALDYLQGQILEFIKKLAEENPAKRLDLEHRIWEVKSLQNTVKTTLGHPAEDSEETKEEPEQA